MGFYEPKISAATANVILKYSPMDHKERHPKIKYYYNSKPAGTKAINRGVMLENDSGSGTGIKITSKASNPVFSEKSQKMIGAKYESIQIAPKFIFLFPTLSFALQPLILTAILLYLICVACNYKEIPFLPSLAISPLIGLYLGQNRLDYWHRGVWIWVFSSCLLLGIIILRNLKNQSLNQAAKGNNKPYFLLIAALLLISAYIRFQGLDFGLPGLFHPDESRKTKIIRGIVETGDLNPHYFRHPNFLLYASAFNTWIYTKLSGGLPELHQVTYLGRCVSATLGTLSVLVTFLIGRLMFNNLAGFIAAAFLALSPLHIVSSRYIKEDAAMLFFALTCFYFAIKSIKAKCDLKYNFLSALFAGFSASSKYSGLLNVIFALLPVYERTLCYIETMLPSTSRLISKFRFGDYNLEQKFIGLIVLPFIVVTVFLFGFLFFTPYSILDHKTFLFDFMGEKQHMERGHTVPITALSYYWGFHIERSILTRYQTIFALLSFVALGFVLIKRKMYGFLLLSSILLFYLPAEYVKAKPEPQPERYVLPCIPFLALVLADFVSYLQASKNKLIKFGLLGITALALAQIFIYSTLHTQSIKNDTRLQAKSWVLNNIPKGSKIITDWHFYGPPGIDKEYEVLQLKDKKGAKINRGLSAEVLKASGYDYFIFSSFSYGRFLMPAYRSHNLSKRFKSIFKEMTPVVVFNNEDYAFGFHNPEIKIFKLK